MALQVYNTLTQRKEEFVPLAPPKVGMYVCGVTVYDLCHIGHARAGIVFDVISRYLRFRGYAVTYVRNITDIDDKIINRANETGEAWDAIAQKFTGEFWADMRSLHLTDPEIEPKATEHIDEMHQMIGELIEKGHAYEAGGSVWFAVKSFDEYGQLSNKNVDDLESGARVAIDDDKRDPLDFALWKGSKPGEPEWESPWGPGRPGWHIECSAMGRKYLGAQFDIHGGGKDLVFPHHENEVAQSHASSGKTPVKYWLHNGFVTVQKEKMSKSLGNFFTIKDLLKQHHPEVIKIFLLSAHYRSPIDFADSFLVDAQRSINRAYDLFAHAAGCGVEARGKNESMVAQFTALMDDDFNTATALAFLGGEVRRLNQLRDELARMKKKSDDYKKGIGAFVTDVATLRSLGGVLGLYQLDPQEYLASAKTRKLAEIDLAPEELASMIESRLAAKGRKDFVTADRIRDEIDSRGILLQDGTDGTDWSIKLD